MIRLPPTKNAKNNQPIQPSLPPSSTTSSSSSSSSNLSLLLQQNPLQHKIKSSPTDLIPAGSSATISRALLSETLEGVAQRTSEALNKIINVKLAVADQTNTVLKAAESKNQTSTYIKVNGSIDEMTGKVTKDRVIRLVEKAVDPLEPAKFKFRAAPKPPGSPPVPILHSPKKKATEEEKKAWDVPISVSNWNNSKGFVVSLDKRIAQTSQLEKTVIGNNFSKLADALLTAEDVARNAVATRARLKQQNEEKQREAENETLRIAAAQARAGREKSGASTTAIKRKDSSSEEEEEDNEDEQARKERDRIRLKQKREIDRDMKLEAAGKRTKAMREEERDISERIALGMPVPKSLVNNVESEFDHRLFNRGDAGMSSGHGAEDEDNLYANPLFTSIAQNIYKPSSSIRDNKSAAEIQNKLEELKNREEKFESTGFKGGATAAASRSGSGPVQFERSKNTNTTADDPLHGIALSSAQRKTASVLEGLSSRQQSMSAGRFAGDVANSSKYTMDEPDEQEILEDKLIKQQKEKESKSKKIQFVKGGND